jgi:hypothetical protein
MIINNRKRDSANFSKTNLWYKKNGYNSMLTRLLDRPINRKQIQRIFRKMCYITSTKNKKKIIRSKGSNVRVGRLNQVLEGDLTYLHCGIDRWGYLFNIFDVFTRE